MPDKDFMKRFDDAVKAEQAKLLQTNSSNVKSDPDKEILLSEFDQLVKAAQANSEEGTGLNGRGSRQMTKIELEKKMNGHLEKAKCARENGHEFGR